MRALRHRPDGPLPVAGQVTSLELFFDLVFVFTITQLTAFVGAGGWAVTGKAALLLVILWWMYGGYAWLTNAAPPVFLRRQVLLVLGMLGNFVTAMAIPHAFGSDRVVFAIGYAFVVAVHAGMYVTEAARITRGMVVQLLGWNMLGAGLGLLGATVFSAHQVWWWFGALVVAVVLPRLVSVTSLNRAEADGSPSFALVPGHFVERHGLMLLIALGESVLAIGVGLGTGVETIGWEQITFAAISLLLAATLYWAYFGIGEDHAAEEALDRLPPERAQAAGLASYGYAFAVILFGIVLFAAGTPPRPGPPDRGALLGVRRSAVRGRRAVLGRARPLPAHPAPVRSLAAGRRWRRTVGPARGGRRGFGARRPRLAPGRLRGSDDVGAAQAHRGDRAVTTGVTPAP